MGIGNTMILKERAVRCVILLVVFALSRDVSFIDSVFAAGDFRVAQPAPALVETMAAAGEGMQPTSSSDASAGRVIDLPSEIDLWSCCGNSGPPSSATGDGSTMRETLYLLSVESALRTVGDALLVHEAILSGNRIRGKKARFRKLAKDLLEAGRDLARQSETLAGDECRNKDALLRAMKDSERVVSEALSVHKELRGGVRPNEREKLRARLRLVSRHLDKALAEGRKIRAGDDPPAK